MKKFLMAATDISMDNPQSNEIYFSVTMRMLTTETNLNNVRLTAGFIDDIAEHAEEYVCMPLTADVARLARGLDIGLTHMYDEETMEFKAPQIGSFFEVHRVEDEHGVSLVGTARISKRDANVTNKIIEMYNMGRLKFSFEIWASELYEENGVTVVDAAPGNRLTAMAIVTTPAIPSAVALKLAAEVDIDAFMWKVYDLVEETFRGRCTHCLFTGLEYAVVYLPDTGKMMRIDYQMDGEELKATDMYEVVFAREVDNMDEKLEAAANTNVETPAVEEVSNLAEEVANTNTVAQDATAEDAACGDGDKEAGACGDEKRAEVENDIDDDIKNESESDAHDLEEMRREVDTLNAELANLRAELEKYHAAEEQAKLDAKRTEARKYAQREGLDLEAEAVKAAIENADYEALAAEVMAKPESNTNTETYRVVAEMNVNPYGTMFERVN